MSGVSLPALARALSAELARVTGLLTVALVAITATRPHVIPRLPAQELLHARRCVVSLLRQIGISYLGQEPTWPAELTRPAFPRSPSRDGGIVHPWQAGDAIEACPELLGLVALEWSDAWARWAGEIELLLDPVWQAAMLAPMAAEPQPEEERLAMAELGAGPHRWVDGATVSARVASMAAEGEAAEVLAAAVPVTEVPFRPDDGFPICAGYMVGADDGKSTLYPTPDAARAAHRRAS